MIKIVGEMMDKNASIDINEDDNRDIYFNFLDDDRRLDEQNRFVDNILNKKNEYLLSMGYKFDDNGVLIPPDNRMSDGILGFAVGDALGVPVEFNSRLKLENNLHNEMIGFGSHLVPEGVWSDDTSMVVATIDSINENGLIDYDNLMIKFYDWLENGNYSSLDTVFDVGLTTKKAILNYKNGVDAIKCGGNSDRDNGNGSLMRMMPIAYYLNNNNYSNLEEVEIINNVSSLTHRNEVCFLGCKIYCDYVKLLLSGFDKVNALKNISNINYLEFYSEETVNKYSRIFSGDIINLSKDDIKSTGYVVDTLEASLWSFINSDNYEEAVVKAINLGGDTDTIGAITGGLAGIVYGRKQIPKRWLIKLKKREYLEDISKKFVDLLNANDNVRKR